MKRLKRIYLGVLFLWLLACGVRWLMPYCGGNYSCYYTGGEYCFCSYNAEDKMRKVPACRYAELNRRLEAAHPGALYFFYPSKKHHWVGKLFVVPLQRDYYVEMPPDARAVLDAWMQKIEG